MRALLGTLLLLSVNLSAYADTTIKGKVSLDPSIAAKAAAQDTVFIFARAENGPRMPLAILKAKVKDLPLNYKLDDSMGMMPSIHLSDFKQIRVIARVSKSGDAMASSGDLEGTSAVVKPGSDHVSVVIKSVVP